MMRIRFSLAVGEKLAAEAMLEPNLFSCSASAEDEADSGACDTGAGMAWLSEMRVEATELSDAGVTGSLDFRSAFAFDCICSSS